MKMPLGEKQLNNLSRYEQFLLFSKGDKNSAGSERHEQPCSIPCLWFIVAASFLESLPKICSVYSTYKEQNQTKQASAKYSIFEF
jgi:hypothetical protein